MNMYRFLKKTVLCFLILLFSFASSSLDGSVNRSKTVTLKIIHSNDIHASPNENGAKIFSQISSFVSEMKEDFGAENVMLLDAGDMASDYSCDSEDVFIVDELYKLAGYDMIALGNHETDCGFPLLISRWKNIAPVIFLAANINKSDYNRTCSWEPFFEAYEILEMGEVDNPVKVAIIGLAKGSYLYPEACRHLFFDALSHYYDVAQSEGAEVFIVVAHFNPDDSTPLPAGMGGEVLIRGMSDIGKHIHLFITGHSHEIYNQQIEGTRLVQAGAYGKSVGIATLNVNMTNNGVIVKSNWSLKEFMESDSENPVFAELVRTYSVMTPFEFRHLVP